MAGTVKPTDPSHFICISCGRTYNYSLREITEKGNQCVNCVSEQGGVLSESDEDRVLTWKRGVLYDAANDYYNAALALAAKRGVKEIEKLSVSGPSVSFAVFEQTKETPVEEDEGESLADA